MQRVDVRLLVSIMAEADVDENRSLWLCGAACPTRNVTVYCKKGKEVRQQNPREANHVNHETLRNCEENITPLSYRPVLL